MRCFHLAASAPSENPGRSQELQPGFPRCAQSRQAGCAQSRQAGGKPLAVSICGFLREEGGQTRHKSTSGFMMIDQIFGSGATQAEQLGRKSGSGFAVESAGLGFTDSVPARKPV